MKDLKVQVKGKEFPGGANAELFSFQMCIAAGLTFEMYFVWSCACPFITANIINKYHKFLRKYFFLYRTFFNLMKYRVMKYLT